MNFTRDDLLLLLHGIRAIAPIVPDAAHRDNLEAWLRQEIEKDGTSTFDTPIPAAAG
jgi:hypothetical protein